MKIVDKILLSDFVEFCYHYPELDFWFAFEEFKKRKNPKITLPSETILPEIIEEHD